MANKVNYKDRLRDPNPSNPAPKAQRDEQKIRAKSPKDVPAKQRVSRAKKDEPHVEQKEQARPEPVEKPASTKSVANTLLRVTDTQQGTIHDEAARQKLRATKATSPTATVKVEGNKVEVVARPEVLHPVALLPHQRDTVAKDRLRDQDDPDATAKADASVNSEPPQWRDEASKLEREAPDSVSSHPKGAV